MKIVVAGGTGFIGSKVIEQLRERGHLAVPASRKSGVNTLTGEGLAAALDGAAVAVDVTDAPSFEETAVLKFFLTSTHNLLEAEATAGVGHHVALSVIGSDPVPDNGYLHAKRAQEALINGASIPYSIVRAAQFFEFIENIADAATDGDMVRLPPALIQPIAADDVASAVCRVAVGSPVDGIAEVAGPERFHLDELVRRDLAARHDPRHVIADPDALYFGATLRERSLLPGADATLAATRFEDWLAQSMLQVR